MTPVPRRRDQHGGPAMPRRPLLVGEPADDEVVEPLAADLQLPQERVKQLARQARHVIDSLVADDIPVLDAGLVLTPPGHPVLQNLEARLADPGWELPDDLLDQDDEDLAEALGLTVEVVREHRPATFTNILVVLLDSRGVPAGHPDEGVIQRFLAAWLDTFKTRLYVVSHIGREAAFETWLTNHLERVTPYNLELLARQWSSKDRKHRPDLICRVRNGSEQVEAGTVLVVELKAGVADEFALAQVLRYLPIVRSEFAPAQNVAGLLVADGTVVGLAAQLRSKAIGYASATELGYREHLFNAPDRPSNAPMQDPEPATLELNQVLTQGGTSLPRSTRVGGAGPWRIGGQEIVSRRSANRALAALLGKYTSEQWAQAQRDHGLR